MLDQEFLDQWFEAQVEDVKESLVINKLQFHTIILIMDTELRTTPCFIQGFKSSEPGRVALLQSILEQNPLIDQPYAIMICEYEEDLELGDNFLTFYYEDRERVFLDTYLVLSDQYVDGQGNLQFDCKFKRSIEERYMDKNQYMNCFHLIPQI